MRKYTEAKKEGNRKWDKDNLDRISIALPKGRKAELQAAAGRRGQSVNGFINSLIDEALEQEGARVAHDLPAGGACAEGIQRGGGGDDGAGVVSIFPNGEPAPRRLVDVSPTPDEEISSADEDLPS